MTNSKMTRKALFTSIMALMLCFAMLTGTTFAWFTDQETSANNKIIAGNLDVELYHQSMNVAKESVDGATNLFQDVTPERWEPGAMAVETFTVENKGNLAFKYEFTMNVVGATTGKNGESFAKMLKIAFVKGALADTSRIDTTKYTWEDFKSFTQPGELYPAGNAEGKASEAVYTAIVWWEPSDADNAFNMNNGATEKMTADFNIQLVATQLMAEEDAFGKDYDENSEYEYSNTVKIPTDNIENGILKNDVVVTSADNVTVANVPAGTKLADGVGELTLTTKPAEPQINNGVYAEAYAIDISVEGLAADNTGIVEVTKKAALPTGLTNVVAFHKGQPLADFEYDSVTGDIVVRVSEFCNFTFATGELTEISDGLYKDSNGEFYVFNAEGLAAMNTMMADKSAGRDAVVNIMADIDFAGKTWKTVDSHADTAFEIEEINGNGYTISNFKISGQAMFSRFAGLGDVIIKDITFDNATVNSQSLNSAILTGHSYQNVLLDNVDVKNSTITGAYKVAPLIATVYNENSTTVTATLKNCDVSNTTVTSTQYDFMATGFVAFVNEGNNDKVVFENCTLTDTVIKGEDKTYKACAFVYCNDGSPEGCYNDVEGVTVTNSYAIYKSNHSNVYTDAAGNMYVFDIYGLLSLNTYFKNNSMNNATWGKTYNIMADIDADEYVWNCVYMNTGDNNNNGIVIDGHGHTISNLYIKGGAMLGGTPCGGNSNATPGYVRDLTFDNVHVEGEHYASVVWGGSAISSNVVYDNVHVINSDIIANCNVGAFVAATGEFNNSVTVKFKNCSVKNTRLTANGKVGQDPTGANAFIGRAYADTKVIFEGDNTVENNTFVNGNGLVGGGIYGYTIWDSTVEGNWRGTGCSNSFTNWDGIK